MFSVVCVCQNVYSQRGSPCDHYLDMFKLVHLGTSAQPHPLRFRGLLVLAMITFGENIYCYFVSDLTSVCVCIQIPLPLDYQLILTTDKRRPWADVSDYLFTLQKKYLLFNLQMVQSVEIKGSVLLLLEPGVLVRGRLKQPYCTVGPSVNCSKRFFITFYFHLFVGEEM